MRRAPLFTPSDRRALLTLFAILTVLLVAFWFVSSRPQSSDVAAEPIDSVGFVDSMRRLDESHWNGWADRRRRAKPFPFNPNTADSATFVRLGLPTWISGRICHYRNAGGRFRRKEDLLKIYGLSRQDYAMLEPYIRISASENRHALSYDSSRRSASTFDTTDYPRKFRQKTMVDLNRADSVTLMRVPGIGAYFANRILRYRDRLGGYVSASQLCEIKNFPKETVSWFTAEGKPTEKIRINSLPFRELLRHPYLNFEQTKAICNYRAKFGVIRNLKELSNSEAFTPEDLSRLEPYVRFD